VNAATDSVVWSSSSDGELGTGNSFSVLLPAGIYKINARCGGIVKDVQITVIERENSSRFRTYLVTQNGRTVYPGSGIWYTAAFAETGGSGRVIISTTAEMPVSLSGGLSVPVRDIVCDGSYASLKVHSLMNNRARTIPAGHIGTMKSFYVLNTSMQDSEPHFVTARLSAEESRWILWLPDDITAAEKNALKQCTDNLEKIILPRILTVWGEWADIDGDGKIAVLVCPTINTEKTAVGFFNPADYFLRNTDTSSESYNPYSNETDILYIAVPDTGSETYSVSSISATIVHELTHAVTFNIKTYERICSGETSREKEAVFLDEGWSHLSENLCGYGVTGGNRKFLDIFLKNTNDYSFCGKNMLGQDDSAGRRGAMTLFLSWLFWKSGGMHWNADAVVPVDDGGIAFLQRMVTSSGSGWESIGAAYGTDTDELLKQMVGELEVLETHPDSYVCRCDPYTGEPVEFWYCPAAVGFGTAVDILPCSFCLFTPIKITGSLSPVHITADNALGNVFVLACQ